MYLMAKAVSDFVKCIRRRILTWAADNGPQLVNRPGGDLCSLGNTSIASGLLLARLFAMSEICTQAPLLSAR